MDHGGLFESERGLGCLLASEGIIPDDQLAKSHISYVPGEGHLDLGEPELQEFKLPKVLVQ